MLVVIEGLPGAGKTTALTYLSSVGFTAVPEIIGQEPSEATEEFFMQNDQRKQQLADAAGGMVVMDRNFLSTLCYNFTHDAIFGSTNYGQIADRIGRSIALGELRQPDMYIFLLCTTSTSLARQNKTNASIWSNEMFLKDMNTFYLSYIQQSGRPYVVIDTDECKPSEVLRIIQEEVEKRRISVQEVI